MVWEERLTEKQIGIITKMAGSASPTQSASALKTKVIGIIKQLAVWKVPGRDIVGCLLEFRLPYASKKIVSPILNELAKKPERALYVQKVKRANPDALLIEGRGSKKREKTFGIAGARTARTSRNNLIHKPF